MSRRSQTIPGVKFVDSFLWSSQIPPGYDRMLECRGYSFSDIVIIDETISTIERNAREFVGPHPGGGSYLEERGPGMIQFLRSRKADYVPVPPRDGRLAASFDPSWIPPRISLIRTADANKVTQIWNNAFSNRPATSIGQIGAEDLRGWVMIDCIQGRDGRVHAVIDYFPDSNVEHCFKGKIIEYNFPDELAALIDEYVSLVDGVVLSLLDVVEERIHEHGLMLKGKGVYIFNLEIYKKTDVVFFDRYPTGRGFLDEFHNNPKSG